MHFKLWKEWFQFNATHFSQINWEGPDELTVKEKQLITSSLQQFQKGEHSEGKHLYQYAKSTGDLSYVDAIKLFIKEEQTHALVLGQYLDKQSILKINHHWVDNVFRFLRKLAGIKVSIRVLLTAEIISMVYYAALHNATQSNILRLICNQICSDEIKHIHFQCYAIKQFSAQQRSIIKKAIYWLQYILLKGTVVIVWWHHGAVMKKGGLSFRNFNSQCSQLYNQCAEMIIGKIQIPPAVEESTIRA
ncbi:MAG: ferritin-like domain-containing protein [Sphingobacteriales bacterium]|nr:ferritin-like domain-containing protein [Sphingobacteriales bacterium]